jgi:hypothetical protein
MKANLATILTITIGALVGFGAPALAQYATSFAQYDAYCLQGGLWGYPGSCMFASVQQCRATAPGLTGTCVRNPMSYYYPEPVRKSSSRL